jgi:chromosome segregation ATPase
MNKTTQWTLLVLLVITVALQIVLLRRPSTPGRIEQGGSRSEYEGAVYLSDSANPAPRLDSDIETRFDRLDKRLAQIENRLGLLTEVHQRIAQWEQQSATRSPDHARTSTLQSRIEARLDRLDETLTQIESRTEALTEIEQKITRLAANLGQNLSDSWRGSTLQSDIETRFDRLDEKLAQIENKLK